MDSWAAGQLSVVEPSAAQLLRHLRHANDIARRVASEGHHPFGAILVAPDQEAVLMEQGNIDAVNHAESTLARLAAAKYAPEFLWDCTLYTSVEPCCMCSGTIYWANIGRVVFGATEKQLLQVTGSSPENPTMSLPASYVFAHGQKHIALTGPVAAVVPEVVALQREFWAGRPRT